MLVASFELNGEGLINHAGNAIDLSQTKALLETIRPFAVFGPVHLQIKTPPDSSGKLRIACEQLFRAFSCLISFDRWPPVDDLKGWLDAGAAAIVAKHEHELPHAYKNEIPIERQLRMQECSQITETAENAIIKSTKVDSISQWVDKFCSELVSDRADGLWPTIVASESGVALGLVYSNQQSMLRAVESGKGVYWSRSRNEIWEKGLTSGATSELIRIDSDCDRDCLRFIVRQKPPGFCHLQTRTCFGNWVDLNSILQWVGDRGQHAGGYTHRLLQDSALLRNKLCEEAGELVDANSVDEVIWEAADLLYFTMVAMSRRGVDFEQVAMELKRRMGQIIRRPGNAKSNP
ncbi:MAG TPA: phosphoribosyl-ATP diphosphatase [Pirellulaceae bacterium]|nr:phosphoribosyl-ATP diphosphatase [Pirellulaceae bacterium]HMO92383.1 phosphoribosyl-ATP diphosphatase [Pirellulaceae bacterium]HMP70754.1 phosphoribosyl-ATP diphosphatase [Pirellulaceae bacterium]